MKIVDTLSTGPADKFEVSPLHQRLQSLLSIAHAVNSSLDLSSILQTIIDAVCQYSSWSMGEIMVVDQASSYSVLVAQHDPGIGDATKVATRWPLDTSPSLRVATQKVPLVISNALENVEFPGYRDDARARGYRTAVVLPLTATDEKGRPMVMSVESRADIAVENDELSFLQTAAELASIAVRNAQQLQRERDFARKLQDTFAVHAVLTRHVLSNAPAASVLEVIQSSFPRPLTVIDATSNVILPGRAPDHDVVSDAQWREFVNKTASGYLLSLIENADATPPTTTHRIDFHSLGLHLVTEAVVEPLTVDGQFVGGMIVFSGGKPFDDIDLLAANEVKFALSVHLMRSYISFRTEVDLQADLLGRLFSGDWRDVHEIVARAGYLGINLTGLAVLVLVTGVARKTAANASFSDARPHLHRRLAQLADQLWSGTKTIVDQGDFLIFVPLGERDLPAAEVFAQNIGRQLELLLDERPIVVVSAICERLEDYRTQRDELGRIAEVARLLQRRGVVTKSDIGIYGLLFAAASGDMSRRFVEDNIGALISDRKRGSELLETLRTFLFHTCSYQRTADALCVHVSTLRYRLQKIEEKCGVDLDDPDRQFQFALAIRLWELMTRD